MIMGVMTDTPGVSVVFAMIIAVLLAHVRHVGRDVTLIAICGQEVQWDCTF